LDIFTPIHFYGIKRNPCYDLTSMKLLSVVLIIAYLMLPTLCFGAPPLGYSGCVTHSGAESLDSGGHPLECDTDYCESTCCCAGHIPLSFIKELPYLGLSSKLLAYAPRLVLAQIIDRIYVPPQNLS